jgi:lysophospholipase L1-like esterase
MSRRFGLILATMLGLSPAMAVAQAADSDPSRFAEAVGRFVEWDRQNSHPPDAVLFVGSSSVVRWQTAERFPDLTVINRGFGGSHISDVNHFIEETVLRYEPSLIVFYAGNNDIAGGKTPHQVLEDYQAFVGGVHQHSPVTPILFISIHPSPLRWTDWPEMNEANALIRTWSASNPGLHYVDVATPMLRDGREPSADLFVEDRLHLSEAGYDLWTPLVARAIATIQSRL